jgi:hypothetical protein
MGRFLGHAAHSRQSRPRRRDRSKVAADQRNGIGVALDVYTKSSLGKRALAAEKLEEAIFQGLTE